MSASCEGYEHRVVLSSTGFSRGVHYWELTIDRYHSDTDPAFGIARCDVIRDQMLGKLFFLKIILIKIFNHKNNIYFIFLLLLELENIHFLAQNTLRLFQLTAP